MGNASRRVSGGAAKHSAVGLAYSFAVTLCVMGTLLARLDVAQAQAPRPAGDSAAGTGTASAAASASAAVSESASATASGTDSESESAASALAVPAAGVASRPDALIDVDDGAYRLFVRSEARHDTARVERLHPPRDGRHEWRCETPCTLTLAPGEYRIWMSAVALDEELRLGSSDVFVEGRPASLIELGIGIGIGVAGLALLSVALLTGEGACFDFGDACPAGRGPLALGAGTFAIALGVGLMIDSSGFIDVTTVRP